MVFELIVVYVITSSPILIYHIPPLANCEYIPLVSSKLVPLTNTIEVPAAVNALDNVVVAEDFTPAIVTLLVVAYMP